MSPTLRDIHMGPDQICVNPGDLPFRLHREIFGTSLPTQYERVYLAPSAKRCYCHRCCTDTKSDELSVFGHVFANRQGQRFARPVLLCASCLLVFGLSDEFHKGQITGGATHQAQAELNATVMRGWSL